jgi:hypothetical protein
VPEQKLPSQADLNTKMIINSSPVQGQKQEINNNDCKSSLWTFFAFPPKALNRVVMAGLLACFPFLAFPGYWLVQGRTRKSALHWPTAQWLVTVKKGWTRSSQLRGQPQNRAWLSLVFPFKKPGR